MTPANFDTPFELKFLAETGVFEGYASVFDVTDSVNDRIVAGAFRDSLENFRKSGSLPPLLWQHNGAEPIGAWREMYEDSHGLFVRGELFVDDIALAKEACKLLKESVVTGLSIGYRTKESYRDEKSGVRVLTRVELLEVSLVTFPANAHARVTGVKKFLGLPEKKVDVESVASFRASLVAATDENKKAARAHAEKKFGGIVDSLYLLSTCIRQATED